MEKIVETIIKKHMLRRSKKEKSDFIDFLSEELAKKGFSVSLREDKNILENKNIVIGDIEKASTIICAHYDTPSLQPFAKTIYPMNKTFTQFLEGLVIFLCLWAIAMFFILFSLIIPQNIRLLVPVLDVCAALFVFFLMFGITNKKNYNDNTSGVAALLHTLEKTGDKGMTAYILFDNMEWGRLGSKGFANAMGEKIKDKTVINLDCLGEGDEIFIISSPEGTEPFMEKISSLKSKELGEKNLHITDSTKAYFPSDHQNFEKSSVICAAGRPAGIFEDDQEKNLSLCKIRNIHTDDDRVLDEKNVQIVSELLSEALK